MLYLLFDSLQQPEVQVVLVAVEEPLVVGEDQVSGVVTPVDDGGQLYVVLVPAFGAMAELHAHVLPPGPESTAARIQAVVNLEEKVHIVSYLQLCDTSRRLFLQRVFGLIIIHLFSSKRPSGGDDSSADFS